MIEDDASLEDIDEDEQKRALRILAASPTKFCSEILGFTPFPYQMKLLEDPSKLIIACAARRTGKSLVIGNKALWFAFSHPGTSTLIVAATQRQSILMFDKLLDYVLDSPLLAESVVRKTRTMISFTNGSKITALPCGKNGRTIRGMNAHLIVIDEAAFVPDEVILSVMMPMLSTTDGTMIMLSTPWDKCYTSDTDVMTEDGWKNIGVINKKDKIACLIDNKVEFQFPIELTTNASPETIEFQSSEINLRVTPGHRMYVRKGKQLFYNFITAGELASFRGDVYFRLDFPWEDGREKEFFDLPGCDWFHDARKGQVVNKPRRSLKLRMDDWLEFFGYWLSKGTVIAREDRHQYFVTVSQSSNGDKSNQVFEKIVSLASRFNFKYHTYQSPRRGENKLLVSNKQLALYLSKLDGRKSIPKELKNLSKRQLRILLDTIYAGDGRKLEGPRNQVYCGIYEKYANDVQELVLKLGFSSSASKVGNCWVIALRKDLVHKFRSSVHHPRVLFEMQKTHCLTVPGGLLFVRRKGKCCWSGNSSFFYRAFNMAIWSKHRFKTSDNPLVKRDFLNLQLEMLGERRFHQEYLAEFVDDESTYFPMSLLRSCIHVCSVQSATEICPFCENFKLGTLERGSLYAGYDPGGMTDPAALVIAEKAGEIKGKPKFRVAMIKTFSADKKRNPDSGEKLANIYTHFNVEIADLNKKTPLTWLIMDSTGIGGPIYEHCIELGLPVKEIKMHRKTQEEIFSHMRIMIEEKRLELPDRMDLLSSLNCLVAERDRIGGYAFSHPHGTRDDLAYALALAIWGSNYSDFFGAVKY